MPGLLIKNVPRDLHLKLKESAARSRRSLNREALVLLEQALADPAGPPTLEEVDRLRVQGARPLTDQVLEESRQSGRP